METGHSPGPEEQDQSVKQPEGDSRTIFFLCCCDLSFSYTTFNSSCAVKEVSVVPVPYFNIARSE